ncbi:MAG: efflux RND transporter periplasmic adaptor subunit [Kiritimatiellae bacterium]|nr:efflux RND transporter periplasmic adaptor subunit [Kiritimatiellia bacterium]
MKHFLFPAIALPVSLLLAACSPSAPEGGPSAPSSLPPVAVRTAVAAPSDIDEILSFTGELESLRTVEVASKLSGRLEKLYATVEGRRVPLLEGTAVTNGQRLGVLDTGELEAQVSLAGAQVQSAEVTLAEKERERRRIEALFAEEVATEQARDAAATAHESAKASLAQAQAQLQLARVNLENAFIVSPMDGVVARRYVDPGSMLSASTPVVRIVEMTPLKLVIAVPDRLLPLVRARQTAVSVALDAVPGRTFDCTVSRVWPTVDTATRTATAEVLLENERTENGDWLLRPGMYATASATLVSRKDVLAVPASALTRVFERRILFVVEDGTARARDVVTGIRSGDRVEILSGLAAGETYVVMGQNKLTDGVPVSVAGAHGAEGAAETSSENEQKNSVP